MCVGGLLRGARCVCKNEKNPYFSVSPCRMRLENENITCCRHGLSGLVWSGLLRWDHVSEKKNRTMISCFLTMYDGLQEVPDVSWNENITYCRHVRCGLGWFGLFWSRNEGSCVWKKETETMTSLFSTMYDGLQEMTDVSWNEILTKTYNSSSRYVYGGKDVCDK